MADHALRAHDAGYVVVSVELVTATAQALETCRDQFGHALVYAKRVEALSSGRATPMERLAWLREAENYIPIGERGQVTFRLVVDVLLQQLTAAAAPPSSVM